jgi:N-acetylglucosaminyldiphosphoundecaprenol N-acetyl-beta-D-mannosaminyltransferase
MGSYSASPRDQAAAVAAKRKSILGIGVSDLAPGDFEDEFFRLVTTDHKSVVAYVNIHAANLAYELPWFRGFLNTSEITYCDGFGIKLAGYMSGTRIFHRYTPPDFIERICMRAESKGIRLYFLGARPGIASEAARLMRMRFPTLAIEAMHGYFDKARGSPANEAVIKQVNSFGTDILFVGFGMPAQEEWISRNLCDLKVRVAVPVGALFDYMSGGSQRAPRWMTDRGLEWLGRLTAEPRRLGRRYVVGIPLFFWRVASSRLLGSKLRKS